MKLIDSHCHMTDEAFDEDRDFIIKDLKNFRVDKIVIPGVNLENSKETVKLAQKYDNVFAQVGCHPEDADTFTEDDLYELEKLAKKDKVVAIGEIGLDYYWRDDNKIKQNRPSCGHPHQRIHRRCLRDFKRLQGPKGPNPLLCR